MSAIILIVGALIAQRAMPKTPEKEVKIVHIEALSETDTIYSSRFKVDYEESVATATDHANKRLSACGYKIQNRMDFFNATDPLQAKEKGTIAEKNGAWLIIGPARSAHFVLLSKGASSTPSVSAVASAVEVSLLGKNHVSMSPTNEKLALIAAREISSRKKRKYISIVSKDCVSCVDFRQHFFSAGHASALEEVHKIEVFGEYPDTKEIVEEVQNRSPDFILLPNYSKTSSHIMAAINKVKAGMVFVGGDGWGDSSFGFVHGSKGILECTGISVRGYPPVGIGLKKFSFGRSLL